jgi:hypothetical protein
MDFLITDENQHATRDGFTARRIYRLRQHVRHRLEQSGIKLRPVLLEVVLGMP